MRLVASQKLGSGSRRVCDTSGPRCLECASFVVQKSALQYIDTGIRYRMAIGFVIDVDVYGSFASLHSMSKAGPKHTSTLVSDGERLVSS